TMRALAQRLQCSQAALYRHVTSREELVVIAVDRAVGLSLPPPPADLDWRQIVEWQAPEFRAFLLAHPSPVWAPGGTGRLSRTSLAGLEFTIGQFMGVGLSFREAYATASAFATFVLGSVQLNLGLDTADPEEQRMRRRLYERLDPQRHPILVAHAEELSR